MNTITALAIVIGVALLILLVEFIRQVYNVKHGRTAVSRWRVLINRFLVLVVLGCLGWMGVTAYAMHRSNSRPAPAQSATSSSRPEARLTLMVPAKTRLDANGQAKVKITASAGAKVTVRGLKTATQYASFTAARDHQTTKEVTLAYAGEYEVVANKGRQKVTKTVTVVAGHQEHQSSSSAAVASSSVASRASSDSASAVPAGANQGANPTPSRATGGAGHANYGYGAGTGASHSSTPTSASPNQQPSAPTTPGEGAGLGTSGQ